MINQDKFTNFSQTPQIAGFLPNDSNIEFVGIRKTKQVLWLQNGSNHYFSDLPLEYFNLLKKAYLQDYTAKKFLESVTDYFPRQVELYTYYMYGELDSTPDIKDGKLSTSENFRDKKDCPSLLWKSKNLNIGKHILTPKQLMIIDLLSDSFPDKAIASFLNISHKTLDYHKTKLFKALGVNTKTELIKLSIKHKIIA